MRKILMAAIMLLFVVGATAVGADVTVTIQHGVGGVTVKDGYVREGDNYEFRNYGGAYELGVGGDTAAERRGFVEFNDIFGNASGQMPLNQTVETATLRLYARSVASEMTSSPVQDLFRVHPLSIDVTDHYGNKDGEQAATGQMCWSYKSWNTIGWGTAETGNSGPVYGQDYRTDDYGQAYIHTDDDGQWIEWDVTDIVQAWQDNANGIGRYENFGFCLRSSNDNWVRPYFDTTNLTGVTDPELVVTYDENVVTHLVLEHGVNGVTVKDGYVRKESENNYGASVDMLVGGAYAQQRYGLVEFNGIFGGFGRIPLDRPVQQATLRLYADDVISQMTSNPVQDKFRVHPLLVDVTDHYGTGVDNDLRLPGEMSWSFRGGPSDPNEGWGSNGTGHSGPVWNEDYDAYVHDDVYIHTDDDGKWIEWDVSAMVSAWQHFENGTGGYENLGFLIRNSGDYWVLPYFVCTNWTSSLDPQLVVDYLPLPTNCSEAIQQGYGIVADMNADCYVDLCDLAMFAARWLDCVSSEDTACSQPWQ